MLKTTEKPNGNIYYILDSLNNIKNSIFLAGPTFRVNDMEELSNKNSWRKEAISLLRNSGFTGPIISPEYCENEKPKDWTYDKQIEWEKEGLHKSSIILFWIPRDLKELPGFTTNVECGKWFEDPKVIVGSLVSSSKNDYLKNIYQSLGRKWNNTLSECVTESIYKLTRKPKIYFTSDTHFTQERTFLLSRRPFKSLKDMDLKIISNWNGCVTSNDIVYHLGDVGNYRILNCLNFKKLYIIPGNYEKPEVLNMLKTIENIEILEPNTNINIEGIGEVELVHEPTKRKTKNFLLFGHVHRLSMVKENALNVGIDCHFFKPIDEETILWQYNGIKNHYDENVFTNTFNNTFNNKEEQI